MQLQRFDPKMVSITQVRRDIDILEDTLGKHDEALVVRNQDLLFVAISPKLNEEFEKFKQWRAQKDRDDSVAAAVDRINALREKYGKTKVKNAGSKAVIRMRDERARKWIK